MMQIRQSDERGHVQLGWLNSRHTFSFGSYHDPAHMGVSVLRVINDDHVAPGTGFDTHPHRDMEILTYVTRGTIEHRDSMGNIAQIPEGEFQLMSAGTGVTHSEYNPSHTEALEFLQIWVLPAQTGTTPRYQQRLFGKDAALTLVVSPDGAEDSLEIGQDARVFRAQPDASVPAELNLAAGRSAYIHVVSGTLEATTDVGDHLALATGDGATISDATALTLRGEMPAEALVFDLPRDT